MKHTRNPYNHAAQVIEQYFQKSEESDDSVWYENSDLKKKIDEKYQDGPPQEILDLITAVESTFDITLVNLSVTFLPSWRFEFSTAEQLSEEITREECIGIHFSCLSNFYTFYRATSFQVPIQSTTHKKTWLPAIVHEKHFAPIGIDYTAFEGLTEKFLSNFRYLHPSPCVRPIIGFKAPYVLKEAPSLANFLFHNSHLSHSPIFM
ncbi:MAG: hypothetical protein AB8F78_15680 [Saprospiraceae bacterium]